ncbi:methylsulfur transfer protein DsrH/TusB [Magnetospirillum sp. XM-1]|uniref:sulfurtransferase complex subunit TusB n=1 Tax=Magnetospirillum sp. XM-1 TaxID=1663591 RepID=UPI00073DC258|nr:sulfurtransferase complex subunit TusB [Magnetospirillum sp. XM-1]CUW41307.1 methylsulfur transfer protein DsrH/TusB [Magnetospirillum sp. XM-1]
MSILHTVNKSPFERSCLDSCLGHAQPGDSVLLMEDAVIAALSGTAFEGKMADAAKTMKLHVLGPDLAARGLDPAKVVKDITVVDYAGFVDLAAGTKATNAWL